MATDTSNTKSDRRKCWDARDAYFKCDDEKGGEACEELRKKFLVLCPKVWIMEEFQRLTSTISTISLQEQKQKNKTTLSRVLTDDEVALLLRTSRVAVEQLMERCSEAVKIGQSECKGVRDLIGAFSNLSPAFHPPSDLVLEEVTLLVDTFMVALASTKVPVESLILFGTGLVQILVIGPCILKRNVCQSCADLKNRDIASAVHSTVKEKYKVEMDFLSSKDSTSLLAEIIAPDWPVPTARTDSFELTFCYAYVMSSTRLHILGAKIQLELLVSSKIYDVIFRECSKYSKLTTLAFKTLASWLEKVSEFGLPLSSEITRQAFTITASSWEVSLSGVRKDNASAFSTLLAIDSERKTPFLPSTGDLLEAAIKQQLWTDVSKYYTISELVGLVTAPKVLEKYADEIVEGLNTSFTNNQLAAAGAHLYESLLRQLTLFYWNKYFLHPILRLISDIDGPSARRVRKLQADTLARSASTEKIRTIQLNILNHWLRITANIFPDALITLRQETFEKLRSTNFESHDHLSFLSAGVLFLSRKKGLWDPLSDSEFRKMATYRNEVTSETFFKTVCVSCKISDKVRPEEFEMILEYLRHHINVDSTRVRQEMTRSMKTFLHRFHVSNIHHQKLRAGEVVSDTARRFLAELLNFLSENLTEDTLKGKRICYQRRIASLQIYLELLRSVNDSKNYKLPIGDSPCALLIKSWHSDPQQQKTLANCIDDQTDNIQITAFSILKESINKTNHKSHSWLFSGLQKCQNPKSHVAQSGVLLILLESKSLYSHFGESDEVDSDLKDFYRIYTKIYSNSDAAKTPVTLLVFNIALKVWQEFKSKPMELTKIKSLHGLIDTMTALVLKSEGPESQNLARSFQEKLLQFVEDVCNFCVSLFMSSTENKDCAPSFAEMGEAIKLAARQVDDEDDDMDDTAVNTSSDERLLVKHLWLNLKACCNFAANIDGSAKITQKSLNILIHVLRRCRHKGAIEAAGESLQHLIGAITKVPKSGDKINAIAGKRSLPLLVLKDFLEDLVSGRTAHKTSTTRRSAGLAIFVHHIVIGDADPEKPLLKVALSQLISALNAPMLDMNVNERDLPQAQTLHILRTLVADASLRVTLTPYINTVAQSALVYLTSTVWSVRNGALQLFGALVPILVGQESSLADFYFLHKDLFETLLKFVEAATVSDRLLQTHSDAVPTLVMLSRLTAPPNLFCSEQLVQNVQRLRSVYFRLLASEIMSVRSLAARGLSRIISVDKPSEMVHAIEKWLEENRSQNAIHGALLAVQFTWDRCQTKQPSDLPGDLVQLIKFISPLSRSKISSDLLLKINTNILNNRADAGNNVCVHTIKYLRTAPEKLNIDHTRNELENVVHQILNNPSLSSEALRAVLFFLQNHPESSNDVIISALTAAQQLIIISHSQDHHIDVYQIDQLFELLNKWQNQSVRSVAFVVLLGLANIANLNFSKAEKIVKLFLSELKIYCSFTGNREPNNQFKMAEALRHLVSFLDPSIARDFLNSVIFFLQSDDSDIRDEAAEIIAQGRFGHTQCLLKLLDPGSIRAYCKTDFVVALSLCDRLLFSDDEMLIALGDVCGGCNVDIWRGCNVDIWRRESPYLEDWCVADETYRQLNSLLDGSTFKNEELNDIVGALRLDEIRPFLKQCERVDLDLGSSDVESAMKSSPFIKNHRKWLFRTELQCKCLRLLQN